jgi:hypothetical protein
VIEQFLNWLADVDHEARGIIVFEVLMFALAGAIVFLLSLV